MNFNPKKLTKKQKALIIIFLIEAAAAYSIWNFYFAPQSSLNSTQTDDKQKSYVFTPKVSIGCSRVVWKDTELHLSATTNLKSPKLQWIMDNKTIGADRTLVYTFKPGKSTIRMVTVSGNDTVEDAIQVAVVDSTDGLSTDVVSGSMINERVFMTKYKGIAYYIDGVSIILDGKDMGTIPECRQFPVSGLSAGSHTWKAQYRGKDIGSGSFTLEAVTKMKITRINIAGSYQAGDTVDAKIFVQNTGTIPVKKFSIKTLVVNHKFEWMGDVAKKEFTSNFDFELVQGAPVEIPVNVKIPEKVSGIRPAGDYSITVQLIVNDKVEETQTVKTVVV